MNGFKLVGFLALTVVAGCASAPKPELSLEEQVAQALAQEERPDDCELYPAGDFRIPTYRYGRITGDLQSRLRGMGYYGSRNVRRETVMERNAGGTMTERVVAITGTGLKWNYPACAVGR